VTLYEIIIAVIISISAVLVIKSSGRLQAVAALGVVGIGVAMIFSIYGAPDLALTQYSIETLTVILFVLVIYKLPKFLDYSKFSHRLQDFFLATAVGLTMTILILMVTANELPSEFKDYYGQTSYILGKGRNIVNVILVDYRALDTLGEIVVLSLAALGVFALLKLKKDDGDSI
jgi:multicomponent Na+:H+ antiporter subunit A